MSAHLSYLKRDGVTADGDKARMFDAETDRADDAAFAARSKDDRHHFRFIVSPEDANEMTDLRAFTRDLGRQLPARAKKWRQRETPSRPEAPSRVNSLR
jgi:type IV secretory pathway VirD2 relaxase